MPAYRGGFAVVLLGLGCPSERPPNHPEASTGASSGSSSSTGSAATSTGAESTSRGSGGESDTSGSTGASGSADAADSSSSGSARCAKNVVVMGYWPPTNEMLRPWSTNATQNPEGWVGENWEGLGYDVYSFFPEFPPDGDPTNDSIGDDGAVGSPKFDLRVDYQATSDDFWRLVDTWQPIILITTSRGGKIGWEVEAIEGGHGVGNTRGPAFDWISDGYGDEFFPVEKTLEPRSWDAISTYRQGNTLPSQLPIDAIVAATDPLGLTDVQIDTTGTSGNFLSGFLGLHGLIYQQQTEHAVAAGHIHVGFGLPNEDARQLIEATVRTVLEQHPAKDTGCSTQ